LKQEDRLLFLKYAIPCAPTLVARKDISEEKYKSLVSKVEKGEIPEGEPEKIFKVAYAMCKSKALEKGKEIDESIIHDYFWYRHDKVVEERGELMGDFDAERCKTYPGEVEKIIEDRATVKTILGKEEYSNSFVPGIKEGMHVVVHRGYVVEEINGKTALEIAEKTGKRYK